jgi:hypothetical protein
MLALRRVVSMLVAFALLLALAPSPARANTPGRQEVLTVWKPGPDTTICLNSHLMITAHAGPAKDSVVTPICVAAA